MDKLSSGQVVREHIDEMLQLLMDGRKELCAETKRVLSDAVKLSYEHLALLRGWRRERKEVDNG